jgi:hypothetical protein
LVIGRKPPPRHVTDSTLPSIVGLNKR